MARTKQIARKFQDTPAPADEASPRTKSADHSKPIVERKRPEEPKKEESSLFAFEKRIEALTGAPMTGVQYKMKKAYDLVDAETILDPSLTKRHFAELRDEYHKMPARVTDPATKEDAEAQASVLLHQVQVLEARVNQTQAQKIIEGAKAAGNTTLAAEMEAARDQESNPVKYCSPLRKQDALGMEITAVHTKLGMHELPDDSDNSERTHILLRDDDELTCNIPGVLPFDKLTGWVYQTWVRMPVAFRDETMNAFMPSHATALLQLLLQTATGYYYDLRSLLGFFVDAGPRDLQMFLLKDVFKKKINVTSRERVLALHRAFGAWVSEAVNVIYDSHGIVLSVVGPGQSLSRCKADEPHWSYDRFDPQSTNSTTAAAAWFVHERASNPRPSRIVGMSQWEGGHPFIRDDASPRQLVPSYRMSDLAHARTVDDQVLIMEMGGACAWMQPQFHPLADWDNHAALLVSRETYERPLKNRTVRVDVTKHAYATHIRRLDQAHFAIVSNNPALFEVNMHVFTENVFKDEDPFDNAPHLMTLSARLGDTLSARLGDMLESVYRIKDDEREGVWGIWKDMDRSQLFACDNFWSWQGILDKLASRRDVVAVTVVDVLCMRIGDAVGWDHFCFYAFNQSYNRLPVAVVELMDEFTDDTAPLALRSYWKAHPGGSTIKNLQTGVRRRCWGCPRLRFPRTTFCERVRHTTTTFLKWLSHANVSTIPDEIITEQNETLTLALMKSTDYMHCRHWHVSEIVWGGCALIRYAEGIRAWGLGLSEKMPGIGSSLVAASYSWEAHFNLDQAELLLTTAFANQASFGLAGASEDYARARKFLRELRNLRSKWKQADAKREKQRILAARQKAQKAEAKQRQLENARLDIVSACVQGAIGNVVQAARERFAEEKQREAYEARAEAVRLAKDERRRKEEHKEMLARVIQINREAAERRDAHLAARAVIEKKAAAREKRAALEMDKKLRSKQWEAERAKYKAGEEEREVRIQQQLEVERRERERRQAEEAARLAEAAAAAKRVREAEAVAAAAKRVREAEAAAAAAKRVREAEAQQAAAAEARAKQAIEVSAALAQWSKEAAIRKAEKFEGTLRTRTNEIKRRLARCFALWRADTADRLHAKRHMAEQARCNAILRAEMERKECVKQCNESSRKHGRWVPSASSLLGSSPSVSPSPSLPPSPANNSTPKPEQTRPPEVIGTVTSRAQWCRDYQTQLSRLRADTRMQWGTGTGWAEGAHTVWPMFGGPAYVSARVQEREQWDVGCATFWANSMQMDRERWSQREAIDESNRRGLKKMADEHLAQLEAKKAEHAIALNAEQATHDTRLREHEAWFQARLDTIAGQNASLDTFEAENRTLIRERANLFCKRLRERLRAHEPNALTSRLATRHECVVCFDALCTHIATACGHVIGCGTCCASLTACPICCTTTTFVEMRFPH